MSSLRGVAQSIFTEKKLSSPSFDMPWRAKSIPNQHVIKGESGVLIVRPSVAL